MQIIALGFAIAVSAAWLWFCMVAFTGDHSVGWRGLIFWVLIASLFRVPFAFFGDDLGSGAIYYLFALVSHALTYIFLYFVLQMRYGVQDSRKKLKILALHFVGLRILGFFIFWKV